MPIFTIRNKDGATYQLDAPDEQTAYNAFSRLQSAATPSAPASESTSYAVPEWIGAQAPIRGGAGTWGIDAISPPTGSPSGASPQPDKYRQAVRQEIDSLKAKGIPTGSSLQRLMVHGMTMNADDEVLAAFSTPIEMVRRGTWNPAEAYRYAKAREDVLLDDARRENGWLGKAFESAGGIGSGAGLASKGFTAASLLAKNPDLLEKMIASALDGIGLGIIGGALDGNSLSERAENAVRGGVEGLVGAATPLVRAGGKYVAPVANKIRDWANPGRIADNQVAKRVIESEGPGDPRDAVTEFLIRQLYGLSGSEEQAHRIGLADHRGSNTMENTESGLMSRNDLRAQPLDHGPFQETPRGAVVENPEGAGNEVFTARLRSAANNVPGAIENGVAGTIQLLSGGQDEVRRRIAEALLSRGEKMDPTLPLRLNDAAQGVEMRRLMASRLGGAAALAVGPYMPNTR
jgi:hypothetical protein